MNIHTKLYEEENWEGHFVGQGGEDYGYKPEINEIHTNIIVHSQNNLRLNPNNLEVLDTERLSKIVLSTKELGEEYKVLNYGGVNK